MGEFTDHPMCGCGQRATHVCSRCRVAKYCSRECQETDWPAHSRECTEMVGMPYTEAQRRYIYARGGHITPEGHARWPEGTRAWPAPRGSRGHHGSHGSRGSHESHGSHGSRGSSSSSGSSGSHGSRH